MYGSGGNMTLGKLIARLERENPEKIIENGFGEADSYRGFYQDTAFAPAKNTTVAKMLVFAKAALGNTYTGYKGGEFRMDKDTDVWIAEYGNLGEALTPRALECILTHGSKAW